MSPAAEDEALDLETLIARLAAFHARPRGAGAAGGDGQAAVRALAAGEVKAIRPRLTGDEDLRRLDHLERWLEQEAQRLAPVLASRHERLRPSWALEHPASRLQCQGRVLLANAIGRDLTAPAVERPVDPACDLASLLVGLESREEPGLANRARDGYLRLSGDYEATRLLSLFQVCHALQGARQALARRPPADRDPEHPALLAETMVECRRYLERAEAHAEFRFPPLVIAVGVSGSGKSRFTAGLVERLGAVRLCSDVERRRLHGHDPRPGGAPLPDDLFSDAATRGTYRRLAELAGVLLDAGLAACVDGTFLARWQRNLLRQQAEARGLPCLMISFEADDATLRRRIEKRARRHAVALETSLALLERQQAAFEPFDTDERLHLVHLDTTADNAAETLVGLIQQHIKLL